MVTKVVKRLFLNYYPRRNFNYRVLMFHDVGGEHIGKFEQLIKFLHENYNIVDYSKPKFQSQNNILLTFDDGFISNYEASKILDKYSVKGVFFVCKNLICGDSDYFSNLGLVGNDNHKFMGVDEIKDLIDRGHTIGNHSLSHRQLSQLTLEEQQNEILNNSFFINETFEVKCSCFAYPFGRIEDFDNNTIKIANENKMKIFTAVRGDNMKIDSDILFRDNIDLGLSFNDIISTLHGCFDIFYLLHRKEILKRYKIASSA